MNNHSKFNKIIIKRRNQLNYSTELRLTEDHWHTNPHFPFMLRFMEEIIYSQPVITAKQN